MTNINMEKELHEARAAGIRALNSLRRAQKHLDSARGWGMFDMLGGGMISGLIKHSKLGDAQQCIEQAQYDLRNFCRELEDVDGFLADFLVQRRINEARARIDQACRQVEDVLYRLGGTD